MFGYLYRCLRYGRVVDDKMIGQVQPESLDRRHKMRFCQGIDRVLLGVGGQYLGIISLSMRRLEIAFERYIDGYLPELMVIGVTNDFRYIDRILSIRVLAQFELHAVVFGENPI